MQLTEVEAIATEAVRRGRVIGVRMVATDEANEEPWSAPPSRRQQDPPLPLPLPEQITVVVANQVFISKDELTPGLTNRTHTLAAFQNPEFYKARQRVTDLRDSKGYQLLRRLFRAHRNSPGKPGGSHRIILVIRIKPVLVEERHSGELIHCDFQGTLRPDQQSASDCNARPRFRCVFPTDCFW